jgi:hypothetical protein
MRSFRDKIIQRRNHEYLQIVQNVDHKMENLVNVDFHFKVTKTIFQLVIDQTYDKFKK